MTDWSVVGEIVGETNLDEVAESVERSLQDAAAATEKAAAGSENMEKSMDSATQAVGSLSGASENLDDDLQEVEDELEDIVTDAGAAAGSVRVLSASMESVDDMDIEVDTNIDELNAAWADMRNEIDDFEHRVDDIIPRGPDGGAPMGDFIGDQQDFERALDQLDDAQDSMSNIADARERAMQGDDDDIADPFRELPDVDSKSFRRALGERLEEPDDRAMNIGRLTPSIRASETTGGLARRLTESRATGTDDFGDALRAVIEASDLEVAAEEFGRQMAEIDTTPALPEPEGPDTFGPDRAGGRIGVPSRAFQTVARGRGSMEGRIPFDEVVEVGPESTDDLLQMSVDDITDDGEDLFPGEGIPARQRGVTAVRTELLDRETRESLHELGEIPWQQVARGVPGDKLRISNEAFEDIDLPGGGGGVGTAGVSDAMGMLFGDDDDEVVGDERRGVRGHLENLSGAAVQTETTLGFMIATLSTYAGSAKTAESATEELDDDVEDLQRSLAAAIPAVQNLSANLGPFNVSLSNLLVTIPALLATVGPLLAVMAGLAGAALAVAGAFAAIVAVGAIGFVEDLENRFAGIEDTSEAVMAIMRGLKESIIGALEPLKDIEIGDVGPQGLFITVLQDAITLIRMFAEAAASLLEMDVVEKFLLNLRAAVLGFSDATSGGMSMIDGLKELMRGALPILEDFLIWLIDVTPEFLAFVGEITSKASPAIAQFAQAFLRLSVLLTEIGTGALNVLLPALATLFGLLSFGLGILIAVERGMGDVSNAMVALIGSAVATSLIFIKLASSINRAFEAANTITQTLSAMNGAVKESDTALEAYNKTIANTNSRLVKYLHLTGVVIARTFIFAVGLYLMADALGVAEPIISAVTDNLGSFVQGFTDATDAVGKFVGVGNAITRTFEFLVGAFLASTIAISLWTGSMYSAVTAMASATVTSLGMIGVLGNLAAQAIFAGLAHLGLVNAQAATMLSQKGLIARTLTSASSMSIFSGSVWSAVTSITALQVAMTAGILGALAAMALGLKHIADNFGVLEAVITGAIALMGAAWAGFVAAVVVGTSTITAALIASGVGAIIVAIGIAILLVINNWDKLVEAIEWGANKIMGFIDWVLGGLQDWIDYLTRITSLQEKAGKNASEQQQEDDDNVGPTGEALLSGALSAPSIGMDLMQGIVPSAQTGGFVEREGLVYVHSNEYILPVEKMQQMAANADTGVNTQTGNLGGTRQSGGGQGPVQMVLNIDNSGGGDIDDRRARQIGRIARKSVKDQRRLEDGR